MKKNHLIWFSFLILTVLSVFATVYAQNDATPMIKSREISEKEGIPVLVKHLPDWENAHNRSTYILNQNDLRNALGERAVLDAINFESGTEAVTTSYGDAKLLLVEFMTPQASLDADEKITRKLTEVDQNQPIFYRRIGNYNAFVFDTTDETAAKNLLDRIKYEKDVQWLGADPFSLKRAERAFVLTTSDIFITTVVVIVGGLGLSILVGLFVGIFYFYRLKRKRMLMNEFSDAGGMTRLNLDGLTPQVLSDRLLND